MMRIAAMTLTGLLVVLAVIQGLVFAALPALNYWRTDIEQALSTQLAVPVKLSEVGVRLSFRGPYLEALDVVVEQPSVRIELRRLQVILDPWASVQAGAPVIAALAVDEGSAVWLGQEGGASEDLWQLAAATLGALQTASERIGAASIDDFSVIADGWTLTRLHVNLIPGQGLLARARLDTEAQTVPVRLDWRFAPNPTAPQVIHWAVDDARLPVPLTEEFDVFVGIQSTGSLVMAPNASVTGSLSVQMRDLDNLGLNTRFTAMVQAESPTRWAWMADRFEGELPGITIKGPLRGQWVGGQLDLAVDRVEIDGGETVPWVDRLLPETVLSRLVRLNQPRISMSNAHAHWTTEQGVSWLADVETATIGAGRGIPTLGPVMGQVYAEGQFGWFDFRGPDATFALPEIFPTPWQNHAVSGRLLWARQPDGLTVIGRDLQVTGQDQDVRGELLLDLPRARQQGLQLELQANASVGAMPGLLPMALDAPVQDFLLKSIQDAEIKAGRIHYAGPLGPTDPVNRRELVLDFPVARIDFQPLAEWPAFVGATGLVRWANQRAEIELVGPEFGTLQVSRVVARQDREDSRLIHVEGTLAGSADAVQAILQSAGVKPAALGRDVLLSGDLKGAVALQIPLGQAPRGSVTMQSTNLRVAFAGWPHVLTDVTGHAEFVFTKGLVAEGLQAHLLGAPVMIDVSAVDDQFKGRLNGALTGSQAVALAGIPVPKGLLSGTSDWRVTVESKDRELQIEAVTSGQGLKSDLPLPLTKLDADSDGSIRVQIARREGVFEVEGAVFDRVRFSGDLATDPVTLQVQASEIDLLGWAGFGGTGDATNLTIMMTLERALLGETPLAIDALRFERTPRSLVVRIDGEDLSGTVSRAGQDPVSIRLDRIRLPEGGEFLDPPGDDPLARFDPGSLPPLAVAIELLERGTQRYERLYLDIRPGPARLDVNNLSFVRNAQLFTGELAWDEGEGGARSALILRAQGPDLGNFLRVNESQALLEAKRGQLTMSVQWAGSPLAFSPLTAEGEISLSLEDGRFLELGNTAEVLRLFGILNIETLTRRLRLDFLDLVKPGVAFDAVKAQARLGDGVLRLNPALEMQGPASSFRLTGDADLRSKTLQQRLAVDIPLTGNLPLASVLLGAPQIGGAIYFVEKAFGTKIIRVGKTEYAIEGAFSDPKITLIPPFTKPKETPNAQSNRDPQ